MEECLRRARSLLEENRVEEALEALKDLEQTYFSAAEVLDLMGQALLARGDVQAGVRYKTLHQILQGTFRMLSADMRDRAGLTPILRTSGYAPSERAPAASPASSEEFPCSGPREAADWDSRQFLPETAATANALMRQRHYDRALEIIDRLVAKNPGDESLRQARDEARKKKGDRDLLNVMLHWLKNLEQLRAPRSAKS